MEYIKLFFDFVFNIDKHLVEIINQYQNWAYILLFLIIFCQAGLILTPFLPGNSLLFAAGTIAAKDGNPLNIYILLIVFFAAAFSCDFFNYLLGKMLGDNIYKKDYRFIKKAYLIKTHEFYEKHGGKTLILARYMPIIRSFATLVAGVGTMKFPRFITYTIIANVLWINIFLFMGYLFGNMPVIKDNFTIVIIVITGSSVIPHFVAAIKHKLAKKQNTV